MNDICKYVTIFTFRLLNEYYLYSEKSFEREFSLNDLFSTIPETIGVHIMTFKVLYMVQFFLIVRLLEVDLRYLYEEEDFIYNYNELFRSIKDIQKQGYVDVMDIKEDIDDMGWRLNNIFNQNNKLTLPIVIQRNTKLVSQIQHNLSKGVFSKLRFI